MVVTISLGGFVADQMQYNLESAQYQWYSYYMIVISKCILAFILSSTDSFIVSQLFSVTRHTGHFKLGSKPAQLYARHDI